MVCIALQLINTAVHNSHPLSREKRIFTNPIATRSPCCIFLAQSVSCISPYRARVILCTQSASAISIQQITPDYMPFVRDLSAHFRKHANLRHVAGNNGEHQHHPTALAATITGRKCVTDSCNNVVVNPRLAYCNGCWQARKDFQENYLA